ncbi:hypothetical protein [Desulfosporosinus sp. FKA]|uniref:hypothetical protein n=1 Tax=Desulfosporosinus sp. FKA TaxID=1969834 RepID=UPI000B4A070A|nr:hypothetical protein [Desulfosporosinus sp. FKA]
MNYRLVDSVFALSTDAHIGGAVRDVVLVINGDVYLEPTAQTDLVIDLGGQVFNPATVTTNTGIFRLSLTSQFVNQLFIGLAMILGLWLARLIISVSGIVLFTSLGFLLRKRLQQGVSFLHTASLRLFGIGLAGALMMLGLIILLSFTVVGIPLAILLFIVGIIAILLGILPVMEYIGHQVLSPRLLDYPALSKWFIFAIGLVAALNLPLIEVIVLLGVAFAGLGVTLTTGWIYFKERKF